MFISYCRHGSVQKWLMNHFHPKLRDCLADQVAPAPKVYVDRTMRRGVHWPSDLRHAVRHSKIMVQLLTPGYFQSPWCMAEWRSMQERQKVLGLANLDFPQGLVYPILYSDSDNFPDEGRQLSWWDFKEFGYPELVYQESRDFIHFHRKVAELAADLAALLRQVPEWQPDWPIVEAPDPVIIPPPPMPRFDP
ncbi:toll/interleukin-1 receptor domain-containing protein [Actinokineospora fastidiosa]|uniref:toll/interleukin-1 receptor domain-containing protein n=1 Tax=Actinokineospora fastidiosa TaxID=1816 RepID=UPI00227D796A|nr:toll/interleukin-1 receptor domain-containing protein [Actinokineospora fastidiosa]